MAKTRLDELFDEGIDYSMPIDVFSRKARTLFNRMARNDGLETRCSSAEYSDGAARMYMKVGDDWLANLGDLFIFFDEEVCELALENAKLKKLNLPIIKVMLNGDEILLQF